ncbi:hypothetical protein FB451DRAFT_1189104 [Mycena latifolia]|nr:hypothetical protein FB451DRAFT_1189104 [Mycena latifolia]
MPRKKPTTAVRNYYSKDLMQRVIYQAFTLGKTTTEIAIDLDMPPRCRHASFSVSREHGAKSEKFVGTAGTSGVPLLCPRATLSARHHITVPLLAVNKPKL